MQGQSPPSRPTKFPTGRYRHYKGGRYEVVCIAKHSETHEDMVVYRAVEDYPDACAMIWVRPLAMFTEQIEVEGVMIPRFQPH